VSWGYYAYVIGDDGHIVNRIAVLCDNDQEAERRAVQLVDGHVIELWQQARKVATFIPMDKRSFACLTPRSLV
jgi:hypothetical protein